MESENLLTLALTYAQGIGDITARKLINHFGSACEVFKEARSTSNSVTISPALRKALNDSSIITQAEKELKYCNEKGIEIQNIYDNSYPSRLKECADAPLVLFKNGNTNLNSPRIVSIVGTRRSTHYGKELVEELIDGLSKLNVIVISGLAIGIDINAHKACLKTGVPTVAVVAHGLDRVYPYIHKQQVRDMLANEGAVVSDFPSGSMPDRENFPKRNRIIAGLSDAVIVVEARETGGALITADIANSYGREVFAFPGSIKEDSSKGCHKLIRNNQAALITCADDLIKAMRWDEAHSARQTQTRLFIQLSNDEEFLVEIIKKAELADIDFLSASSGWNSGKIAATLLNLELSGVLKALPGKVYKIV